ncbi:D-tyrosyl-tRNA(Tyr) deacylase [Stagnimonas aquatica]|uniref:D-aminoacyl-tRNA deacylase n=1 Tax=Stagnimonas aquatica TaxID=2689987 RepID=A0A3N0VLX3_9GAMM|nr:D-aminoacyl-tRNA deacylase [Stagnimonas aquatica]ROH93759.1 D-tyrosyl-tRNA(Tyr) deacylase [Stagnimonas aquatica]
MIGLLQRVSCASVRVNGEVVARIDQGLLVLVGVARDDDDRQAPRLAQRLLDYRLFADADGKMNRSLLDIGGGLILVPQFTLAADTRSGSRASFTSAAPPERARALFEQLLAACRARLPTTQSGVFGADMKVALVNDGPVSFLLS